MQCTSNLLINCMKMNWKCIGRNGFQLIMFFVCVLFLGSCSIAHFFFMHSHSPIDFDRNWYPERIGISFCRIVFIVVVICWFSSRFYSHHLFEWPLSHLLFRSFAKQITWKLFKRFNHMRRKARQRRRERTTNEVVKTTKAIVIDRKRCCNHFSSFIFFSPPQ